MKQTLLQIIILIIPPLLYIKTIIKLLNLIITIIIIQILIMFLLSLKNQEKVPIFYFMKKKIDQTAKNLIRLKQRIP